MVGLLSLLETCKVELHLLCLVGCVDYLHDDLLLVGIPYGAGEEAILVFIACEGLACCGGLEHVGTGVVGIHLLHVV